MKSYYEKYFKEGKIVSDFHLLWNDDMASFINKYSGN